MTLPTPERWAEIERLLDAALELAPEERSRWLDRMCANDPRLRAELERLLGACEAAGAFLEEPAPPVAAALTAGVAGRQTLEPGERLGSYEVVRELGRGGMAVVYLARDHKHHRPVALKVLHPELAVALGPQRFLREIEIAANLTHPHILPLYDSGEAGELLYYVMPFIEGESLRVRLERDGPLPLDDALQIARQVLAALGYAHAHGVLHRDIKPENILLEGDQALVADFGIARAVSEAGTERLTETGLTVGTPAYMSPEQASAEAKLDGRSDLYSLGCVLYEMLTGEPPFTARSAQAVIAKRMLEPVPHVRTLRESVPQSLDRTLSRAMAKVPADRFATAVEFAEALTGHPRDTIGGGPLAGPTGTPPRAMLRTRRVRVGLIGAALAALAALSYLLLGLRTTLPGTGGATPAPAVPRLAVLPFENLGRPQDEYFADGITDAVRGKLAALPGLQVIARSSSSQYKHSAKSPRTVGQELGVEYLLTGTVRWESSGERNRVQVSPELVRVATGSVEWHAPFDAAITDVFQVQADVATRVADALNLALDAPQRQTLAAKPAANLPAYDAYLRAEAAGAHLARFDATSLQNAIDLYERAVALDPGFVDAWAQLARAHALYFDFVTATPGARDAAKQAADRAEAIAPGSAAAAYARGYYLAFVQADARRALATFREGLELEPRNVDMLIAVANQEREIGRLDSALALLQAAQTLDPRSLRVAQNQSYLLFCLRRYSEARSASERALALDPEDLESYERMAMIHLGQGDLTGARAVARAAERAVEPVDLVTFFATYADLVWVLDDAQQDLVLRLRPSQGAFGDNRATWALALTQIYYLRGDQGKARIYADSARLAFEAQLRDAPNDSENHVLYGLSLVYLGVRDQAIRAGKRGTALSPLGESFDLGPYNHHQLARIYLLAGEPDRALDLLESLLKVPYWLSPGWLRIDPNFAPLLGNPRFERLVNRS